MAFGLAFGLLGGGLACRPDPGSRADVAEPADAPVRTAVGNTAPDTSTPRGLCLAGCERVESCGDELLGGDPDAQSVALCRRECGRLGDAARAGMPQLRTCLATSDCAGFRGCVQGEPVSAEVPVPSAPADLGRCEALCASTGDCAVATERRSKAGATEVETGCLSLCSKHAETSPTGRALDRCAQAESCEELLSCIDGAWSSSPGGRAPALAGPAPAVDCGGVCEQMIQCSAEMTGLDPKEFVGQRVSCVRSCQKSVNAKLLAELAPCMRLDQCNAVLECISRTGAASP